MAKEIALKGSMGGFAFDVKITEASDESLLVTGTAGSHPVTLIVKPDEDKGTLNISGMFLGKECIVNGEAVGGN